MPSRTHTHTHTQALCGEPLTLYGDGLQTRSFCYVSETVDGLCRLMVSGERGPINIGNPCEFTIKELAEKVRAMIGAPVCVRVFVCVSRWCLCVWLFCVRVCVCGAGGWVGRCGCG